MYIQIISQHSSAAIQKLLQIYFCIKRQRFTPVFQKTVFVGVFMGDICFKFRVGYFGEEIENFRILSALFDKIGHLDPSLGKINEI